MRFIPLLIFISFCTNPETKVEKQEEFGKVSLDKKNSCNYSGTLDISSAYSFKSDREAETALKNIMKHTGLPTNFLLIAADVDNAAATIYENNRYILYNQRFMEDVRKQTKSNFGPLSILSHEIAHHLSGHTLFQSEARPQLELEADRFSGFILAKMGATIDEACIAMELFGGNSASSTHPAKRSRLSAIVNGWKEAKEDNQKDNIKEVATPNQSQGVYVVNVIGEAKFITIRNRSLSPEEYRLGNSGTQQGNELNKQTVITNLPNGTELEVLSTINKTYYVKAKLNANDIVYGYIVKNFGGKPTITAKQNY